MKKIMSMLAVAVLAAGTLSACKSNDTSNSTTASSQPGNTEVTADSAGASDAENQQEPLKEIVVGASPAPHAEILEAARGILAEQGYDLVIKEYTDYIQPNLALADGSLDANYFQHYPYLEEFNVKNGTKLKSIGATHYEPLGIYAGKTAALEDLKDGAKIAVPNDATNEARALILLEAQGLITLKTDAGFQATKNDIEKNDKNLEIIEMEAAQIPRSISEVDLGIVNGNYAIAAGMQVGDALASEDAKSESATTYGNIIAVKEGREEDEALLALFDALTSDEVKKFIEEKYEGAVIPLF